MAARYLTGTRDSRVEAAPARPSRRLSSAVRGVLAAAGLVLAAALLAAQLSATEAASGDVLRRPLLLGCLGLGLLAALAIVVSVWLHHRRQPRPFHRRLLSELLWTLTPLVILALALVPAVAPVLTAQP